MFKRKPPADPPSVELTVEEPMPAIPDLPPVVEEEPLVPWTVDVAGPVEIDAARDQFVDVLKQAPVIEPVALAPAPVLAPTRDILGEVVALLAPYEDKASHGGDIKLHEMRALRKAIEALRA